MEIRYSNILLAGGVFYLAFGNHSQHRFWGTILCLTGAVGIFRPGLDSSAVSLCTNSLFFLLHLVLLVLSPLQIILMRSKSHPRTNRGIITHYEPEKDEDEDIIVE